MKGNSVNWQDTFNSLLNAGTSAFNANASNALKEQDSKNQLKTAQAQATTSSNTLKFALIGGGVLAVLVVIVVLFKRGK